MNRIGLYFLIFVIWGIGVTVFAVYKTKGPGTYVKHEVTQEQKDRQKELKQKIDAMEQTIRDNDAKIQKAQTRNGQLDDGNNIDRTKKRSALK